VRHLTRITALLLASACSSEEPAPAKPACALNAFRACESEECSGVQQCLEPGFWGSCECVVTDASFPDAPADAATDAVIDAATDTDADASDGAADAEAGASDGS
jgi:hypothetical protein